MGAWVFIKVLLAAVVAPASLQAVPAPSIRDAAPVSVSPAGSALSRLPCLIESDRDSAVILGLDRMYRMDYEGADSVFSAAFPSGSPGRSYFRGLNLFNRFNDRGDSSALFRAESLWSEVAGLEFRNPSSRRRAPSGKPASDRTDGTRGDASNLALYQGLSTLQLSYVASLTGHGIRAANLGRKAAGRLRPLGDKAEAAAALALYDYYKAALLKGVDWIPFLKADAAGPLWRLEESLPRSRYLREVLQTSLLWLYYDAGRFEDGLRLIDAFLARYPANRTYRQIRADFLFRKGFSAGKSHGSLAGKSPGGTAATDSLISVATREIGEARDIHEGLKLEYKALMDACPPPTCIPIGYLSSVGNLVKIYGILGNPDLRRKHVEIWFSSWFAPYLSWLPSSLRREVGSRHP